MAIYAGNLPIDLRAMSTPAPDRRARRLSALIVDGFADTAQSLAELVRLWGFEAEVASTGAAALRVAARVAPDVVFLELRLPDADGCDLARKLRDGTVGGRPLLVAVTTCGHEADRRRSAEAGVTFHLVKPADPTTLQAILTRLSEAPPA